MWDSQRNSACEVIAANSNVDPAVRKRQQNLAAASTKLLGHGFWVEAASTYTENPASYNLVEEWLCDNVKGSYP
jgi:hypothetical protein